MTTMTTMATIWELILRDSFVKDQLDVEHFTQLEDEGYVTTSPSFSTDDLATAEEKYITLDNGGRPYLVSIHNSGRLIRVYRRSNQEKEEEEEESDFDLPLLEIPHALRFWPGIEKTGGSHGSIVLVQVTAQDYILISTQIASFRFNSQVTECISNIGNSSVPYSFALTESGKIILFEEYQVLEPIPNFEERFAADPKLPYTVLDDEDQKTTELQLTTICESEFDTATIKRPPQKRHRREKKRANLTFESDISGLLSNLDTTKWIFQLIVGSAPSKKDERVQLAQLRSVCRTWRSIIDSQYYNEVSLHMAAASGSVESVRHLLTLVDPYDGMALRRAVYNGHEDVVRLLLQDSRVDPSLDDHYPIRRACQDGNADIVRLLLCDERVDPSAVSNHCLRHAVEGGHVEVVKMLLDHPKVDPADVNQEAFRRAAANGREEIVRLLLGDKRVDPAANDNQPIRDACERGHTEIVKLLLKDKRVDPTVHDSLIYGLATQSKHEDIVELLKQDGRVEQKVIEENRRAH